jgi:hypothetical protein
MCGRNPQEEQRRICLTTHPENIKQLQAPLFHSSQPAPRAAKNADIFSRILRQEQGKTR